MSIITAAIQDISERILLLSYYITKELRKSIKSKVFNSIDLKG